MVLSDTHLVSKKEAAFEVINNKSIYCFITLHPQNNY